MHTAPPPISATWACVSLVIILKSQAEEKSHLESRRIRVILFSFKGGKRDWLYIRSLVSENSRWCAWNILIYLYKRITCIGRKRRFVSLSKPQTLKEWTMEVGALGNRRRPVYAHALEQWVSSTWLYSFIHSFSQSSFKLSVAWYMWLFMEYCLQKTQKGGDAEHKWRN